MIKNEMDTRSHTAFATAPEVFWKGADHVRNRNWPSALREAQKMLREHPEHLGALEALCQAQLNLGNYERALLTIRRLIRINPNEAGYETLRASALQSMGRLFEAMHSLSRAHSLCRAPQHRAAIERELDIVRTCLELQINRETQTLPTFAQGEGRPVERRLGAVPMIH